PYFKKAVIDADALAPEIFEALIQNDTAEFVITPHYHELVRTAAYFEKELPAKKKEMSVDALEDAVLEISKKLGVAVLLKGREDLIANGGEIRYNSTGNAGMSVGGTGDVLAGIVGSLLAKNGAAAAAGCGAYICGKAGDAAYAEVGDSLIPADLIDKIPFALSNGSVKGKACKHKKSKHEKSKYKCKN
ncbi:MAG: NAD(P)H-hydrate dehydratase, partial [Methanosarcinales archaeon]|nr:NAD(P)H-hydrate dehydratase [Methanosarcinales archaeon]